MTFEKEYLERKLKGALAEQLFELLHLEMNCQVYRTGHEFLYPHIFQIANTKKKFYHKLFKEQDYQEHLRSFANDFKGTNVSVVGGEDVLKKSVGGLRFKKSIMAGGLASSPDFTIISPSGCIEQFEVKFRFNGELKTEEKNKYLGRDTVPNIFIIMVKKPYLKVLRPWMRFPSFMKEPSTLDGPFTFLGDEKGKINIKRDLEWIKNHEKRTKTKEALFYQELKREKDGSLIFRISPLHSEYLVYSVKLLEKYEKVIQKWFS